MMIPARDRLRAAAMPPFKLVDAASEYAALDAPPPAARLPAAYILPLGSQPGASGLVNRVRQRVVETIGVVILAGNLRDARGGAAAADIVALRDAVRTALLGWTPAAGWEQAQLAGGQLIGIDEGVLAWQERFSCGVLVSQA
jgi:hypothetical protein